MPRKRRGPVDDKILDRTIKLLRLAAPSSGSTEHERASAALEAARLIDEYDIPVGGATVEHHNTQRSAGARTVSPHAWVLSVAVDHCSCAVCHNIIAPRDVAWVSVRPDRTIVYRHNYGTCAVA